MLIRALKIGIGSAVAIMLAELLQLEFATSAGTIALLTIVSTKWDTVRLAWTRIVSFGLTIYLAFLVFNIGGLNWVSYGIFIFLIAAISFLSGWESALSVNAVTGSQLLMTGDFSLHFILNEFYIVLIGISVAVVINLFNDYTRQQEVIVNDMRYTEFEMKAAMQEIADYLVSDEIKTPVWDRLIALEDYAEAAEDRAWQYQNDTFVSHPEYYINYFVMRIKQINTLHNLHYQVKILKSHPVQAQTASGILKYMKPYIAEMNDPEKQLVAVKATYRLQMADALPSNRGDLEGKMVLFHILMDLEQFLVYKQRFINTLDDKHKKIYWEEQPEQPGFKRV